eukprot:jgi/Astpho2/4754/fgenesh1_pg.00067_%23_213_t
MLRFVLALCLSLAAGQPQIFYSEPEGLAFLPAKSPKLIGVDGVTAMLSSLLSIPADSLSRETGSQLAAVLQPNLFSRPRAVMAVQLAGVSSDNSATQLLLKNSLASAASFELSSASNGLPASQLMRAVESVVTEAQQSITHVPLDHSGLLDCSDACLEESLKAALKQCSTGGYTPGSGSLQGVISLRRADGTSAQLSLTEASIRLWANELAALYQTGTDAAEEHERRVAQGDARADDPILLEATLVSLQALQGTPEYHVALEATVAVLRSLQQQLARTYDNRVATQIILLGRVPQAATGLKGLAVWKQTHMQRRTLLQSAPSEASSVTWSYMAAAVLTFIILAVSIYAAIHCLVNMDASRDSLLYSGAKTD